MRKLFTRFLRFFLLSVLMVYSTGLYAQNETQSTVELFAGSVDKCYNASNSYASTISVKDFIKMKSFSLTLTYDKSEFAINPADALANVNPLLLGGVTVAVDIISNPIKGIVKFTWTSATEVTIGNNVVGGVAIFDVKFKVVNFPNNNGVNLFNSDLTWDVVNSTYYYVENWGAGGSYQVETTRFNNGTLNVPVNYTAANFAYTVTPATCAGGTATIAVTNPVGTGMKYYFNGSLTPSTSPLADTNAPSVNTVRVEDANGCFSHLFTINVTAPDPLIVNGVSIENPLCFNGQGEIQFDISGGSALYTYWVVPSANSATVETDLNTKQLNDPVFAPYKFSNFQVLKPAGTYYVAVNDANGCIDLRDDTKWKQVTITAITAPITYTTLPTNTTCNGDSNGSIAISAVAGGTGPAYSVSIDDGPWFATVGGAYTFSNLKAKTYAVQVKDQNGCILPSEVIIDQPTPIVYTVSYTDATCAGGATGSISIPTVSGGTGPYTFAVALDGQPAVTWVATGTPITGLVANYYSVWVKDAKGCIQPFMNQDKGGNVLPIQAPGALTFTTNSDVAATVEVACNGGNFTLLAQGAGGKSPYTYSFDGGVNYSSTQSLVLTGLVADAVVNVYVKDANNCIVNRLVTVDVPVALTIDSFADPLAPTCSGGTDGRITVNATGGVTPYQYSTNNATWYNNKVLALPEGATTVYVKDANNCTISGVVTIPTLTVPAFTALPTAKIACFGNTTTEGIAITGLTWQAGRKIQYLVSSSSTTVYTAGSVFVPASVNGVAPVAPIVSTKFGFGEYYVGARDEYGCTILPVKKVNFTQNAALVLSASKTKDATCSGAIDGSITINTTGGNGIPKYAMVNNVQAIGNLVDADFQQIETYDPLTKIGKQIVQASMGTYYVVLRDVCNTTNLVSAGPFDVNGYKPIALAANSIAKKDMSCNNVVNGEIIVTGVSGGQPEFDKTGLYTYKLYKNGVLVVTTLPNTTGTFTGLSAGAYYVTVTDASNCTLATTATVNVANPDVLTITKVAVTHFTCAGYNNGVVAVTAAGGTGAYWLAVNASSNGTGSDIKASDWIAFPAGSISKTYIATSAGVHTFFVKDANGCVAVAAPVTVLEPKVITAVATLNTPVSCTGGADGSIDINATGGFESTTFPAHAYLFSLNANFSVSNTTGIFTGLAKGDYKAYVKATDTPAAVGDYTYPMIPCVYEVSFTINAPAEYAYKAEVTKTVKCRGGNDGELTVTVISGGTPFVNITTGQEYDVQLTTTASPLLLPGSWVRTSGKVAKFSNLPHAIYSVWIKDSKGCILPTGAEVLPPAPVPVDWTWHRVASWEVQQPGTFLTASALFNNDVKCAGGSDGKFTVTAVGGVAPYKYAAKISILPAHVFAPDPTSTEWKDNLGVFENVGVGTWIIWAMDANGCIVGGEGLGTPVDEWRVQIRQPNPVTFNDLESTEVLCFGDSTGTIKVSGIVSAAGGPYTFNISGTDAAGKAVNKNYSGLTNVGGVYILGNVPASETKHAPILNHTHPSFTVTVTDKNGCPASKKVVVWQNPALSVNIVKADGAFLCSSDNNGVIEALATGGTNWDGLAPASYSYQLYRNEVVYTAWQPVPSFIVQVGYTWRIEVKDGNGCKVSDQETILAPIGVTATLLETTCFSDAKASVIVKASGEAGRTFMVRYMLNTDAAYGPWSAAFADELPINNLVFANEIATENFYYFQVKDDKGCVIQITKSFVPTQHPLEVTVVQATDQLSASVTITGGISPYSYNVATGDTVYLAADGNTFQVVNLKSPATSINVYDAHGCKVTKSLTVAPLVVTAVPNGGNNQDNAFNVVLTFNRIVTVAAGDITGGTYTPGTGTTFTVAMGGVDSQSLPLFVGTGIVDVAGNTFAGKTFYYKVGDHVPPTLEVTAPAVPTPTVFDVVLKFSEPVSGVSSGLTVTGGILSNVSGNADEYTLTIAAAEQAIVKILLSDIKDVSPATNAFADTTLTYTVGDFTAPILVTKAPTLVNVLTDTHPTFTMNFSEDVKLGVGGNLVVYKLNSLTPALTLPITADMIVGKDVTVSYTQLSGLEKSTRYYVLVDASVFTDNAGNKFAGVKDVAAWTFKTGANWPTPNVADLNIAKFKVYPNPFDQYVDVESSVKLSKVVITNIAGQTVKQVVNPSQRILLSELRSGIYFISLYDNDNVIAKTAKIVKR